MRDRGEDQDRTRDPALSAPPPPAQGPGRVHRRGAAQERPGGVAAWTRRPGVHRWRSVINIAADWGVTRGSVNRWLQWYDADHVDGLWTSIAEGPAPKLTELQRATLTVLIERGPIAAGYQSGVWTGPMIGDLIEERFGIRYHNHHVPRLLHQLGFSVQRPRKRLARADLARQATWLRKTLPAIKKRPDSAAASLPSGRGELLARWNALPDLGSGGSAAARRYVRDAQDRPRPRHGDAGGATVVLAPVRPVFNASTFLDFLKEIVRRSRRKVFPGHRQRALPQPRRGRQALAHQTPPSHRVVPLAAILAGAESDRGRLVGPPRSSPPTTGSTGPPTSAMTRCA